MRPSKTQNDCVGTEGAIQGPELAADAAAELNWAAEHGSSGTREELNSDSRHQSRAPEGA